jgi:polyferredoxin
MTYLFLVGMVVLGFVIPRWWTIGVGIGTALALAWLFDATRVHPTLEPALHFLAYFVTAVAAGASAGIGVLVRRFGGAPRPRDSSSASTESRS